MIHRIEIALAPGRVPFACFGLSRVRFAGCRVPFFSARAPKGMLGLQSADAFSSRRRWPPQAVGCGECAGHAVAWSSFFTSSVCFADSFSRSLNRRLWHCRAKSSFRSPLPFANAFGVVPTGHPLISSASRGSQCTQVSWRNMQICSLQISRLIVGNGHARSAPSAYPEAPSKETRSSEPEVVV